MTWIEFITVVTALASIWIAWAEARRNNRVMTSVRSCRTSFIQSYENNERPFARFELVIQNRGICLHDVSVSLVFHPRGEPETAQVPLFPLGGARDAARARGELAKGMSLKCQLISYRMSETDKQMLAMLADEHSCDARILVYSQGYLAAAIQLNSQWSRGRAVWNKFAYLVNSRLDRRRTSPGGTEYIRAGTLIPRFPEVESQLLEFARDLQPERSRQQAGSHWGKKAEGAAAAQAGTPPTE